LSDPLTESVPADGSAAPSVEVTAPEAPAAAVEEASGNDGTKVVPVERFNGLMRKFNETQAALDIEQANRKALADRLTDLEAKLESDLADTQEEPEQVSESNSEVAELKEQVAQLTSLLLESKQQETLSSLQQEVVSEYPEVSEFLDLIVAEDAESYRQAAAQIAERVRKVTGSEESTTTPAEAPAEASTPEPEAPVVGVGPGTVDAGNPTNVEDRIAEAIKSKDFGAYLQAASERAAGPDADLTLVQ
jgi:hypothetical protein